MGCGVFCWVVGVFVGLWGFFVGLWGFLLGCGGDSSGVWVALVGWKSCGEALDSVVVWGG